MIVCCRRTCDETQAQLTQRCVRRRLAIVGLLRRHRSMGAKQVGERCDRARRKQGRGQQRDEKRCPTIAAITGDKLHLTRVYLRFRHITRCSHFQWHESPATRVSRAGGQKKQGALRCSKLVCRAGGRRLAIGARYARIGAWSRGRVGDIGESAKRTSRMRE